MSQSRLLNIAIVGPSTLPGRVLCNYYLHKPNTRVTAINHTPLDTFHTKWGLNSKKYFEVVDLENLDKSGMGLSATKAKVDVVVNASAGLSIFAPLNWRYLLRHPMTAWKNFDPVSFRPWNLSEGFHVQERLINSHAKAADTTRRVIHATFYEDQPDLYIINSSYQYYDDDMDNRIVKEVTNFANEGNQNKMWINKIYSNMEAAGDLGNKIADAGYERHDLLEKDNFELKKQDLETKKEFLIAERDEALREEQEQILAEKMASEKNEFPEEDPETKLSEKPKHIQIEQTPLEIEYNHKLDMIEDQIAYYSSLDYKSTEEPNNFFPARMIDDENKPELDLFDDSQSVTRQVTLRTGVILTEPNVNGSLNQYYYQKKRGVVNTAKFNWIHQEDYCRLVDFCIRKNDIEGILNAVSPADITHGEYTQAFRFLGGVFF